MAAPGSHTFFHKPPVNPNLATLLHCTQISAINFPHCAVARLSAVSPPPSPLFFLLLTVLHPLSRPSALAAFTPLSLFPLHKPACDRGPVPSLTDTSHRLFIVAPRPRGPHCHWQTDLNGGIKSIRSNGTRYIRPNENSVP